MSTLGWLWMFDPLFSVLNWVLKHSGLVHTNVSWLSNSYWAMFSIITVNVWRGLPFFAITLLAGLVSISPTEKKTLTVGILTELIRGHVYFWGALMGGALIGSVPVVLF
jgi:hypothetical protein